MPSHEFVPLQPPARTPSPEPLTTTPLIQRHRINILHPSYDNEVTNVLLSFAATDTTVNLSSNVVEYGVHPYVIYSACCIITDNRQDGWLAKDRQGLRRVDHDSENLLQEERYWFHLPPPPGEGDTNELPYRYSVVPTFRMWRYPARPQIPAFEAAVQQTPLTPTDSFTATTAVRLRDRSCRLSAASNSLERAHLVPASEHVWFSTNGMGRYSPLAPGRDSLNSEYNAILLREDLHTQFDKTHFSFVPKPNGNGDTCLVAHFNTAICPELYRALHNKRLRLIRGVAPQYLHARFAWDIFPLLLPFLQAGERRLLTVREGNDGRSTTRELSGQECIEIARNQGRWRSTSPSKRKLNPDATDADSLDGSFDSAVSGLRRGHDAMEDPSGEYEYWEELDEFERGDMEEDAEQERRRARRIRDWKEEEENECEYSDLPQRGRKRDRSVRQC